MKVDINNLNMTRLNLKKLKQIENLQEVLVTESQQPWHDLKGLLETTLENKGVLNLYEEDKVLKFNPRILEEEY